MFKKFILLGFFALFFASMALGEAKLVSPFEKFTNESQALELGSVQAGETFELIFSSSSGMLENWETVEALSLPEGWNAMQLMQAGNKNTLILKVNVPKNSENNAFLFKAKLSTSRGFSETASFLVFVQDALLSAHIDSLKKTSNAGEQIMFTLSLNNESIAEHSITITSSLPLTWFKPLNTALKPKSSKTIILSISPKNYGEKKFTFFVKSLLNKKTIQEIRPIAEVSPTLKSKYEAALYGFPFFTPSLAPYYIFNSFISRLS